MTDHTKLKRQAAAAESTMPGRWSVHRDGMGSEFPPHPDQNFGIDNDHGRAVVWHGVGRSGGIWHEEVAEFIAAANPISIQALIAESERLNASFKNFHRSLCERFGYFHDEIDWQRDQVSLEEHIATQFSHVSAENAALRGQIEALQRGAGQQQEQIEALNSAVGDLERSRVAGFEEYDFTRLKGRAGAEKVFEITIETECGCYIAEGEYTVRVTHLLGNWLGEDDFSLIEEAVAEVIAELNLPEEGHTSFIAYESGERQDVFWTKWFEIATVASVLAEPGAAVGKGGQS